VNQPEARSAERAFNDEARFLPDQADDPGQSRPSALVELYMKSRKGAENAWIESTSVRAIGGIHHTSSILFWRAYPPAARLARHLA